MAASYRAADLVVVNTCGFIDAAVDESLDAIGEALAENGKVIVTGCLGAQPQKILDRHPQVLKITGPQRYEEVVASVHEHLPPKHEPFVDLVPAQGVKLTPRHYAYLKISEGCNHRCSFCIIPSMRGDLVSRPIGEVLREAEQLVRAGVKEILVISQDTSAYGVDLKYAAQRWREQRAPRPLLRSRRRPGRARRVDPAALRLSLSARRSGGRADGGRQGAAVSRHPLPARQRPHLEADETAGGGGRHPGAHRRLAARGSGHHHSQHLHRRASPGRPKRISRNCSTGCAWRSSIASAASSIRRSKAPPPMRCAEIPVADEVKTRAPRALHGAGRRDQRRAARAKDRPHDAGLDRPHRGQGGRHCALQRAMRPKSTARYASPAPAALRAAWTLVDVQITRAGAYDLEARLAS